MVYKKPSTNTTLTHSHTHTHTKLCQLAGGRSEGKLSNSWGSKRKSWTHLPSTFDLINTRNKKIKPQIYSQCSFYSAAPITKKNSSTRQIKLTCVTDIRAVTHKSNIARCLSRVAGFQPKSSSLQQKQSIPLASFLQCRHLHQSRFLFLICNKSAAEA